MIRLLTPLLVFILGISISIYSYYVYRDFSYYGAAFFPTIIGVLLSIFSIIDFFMEIKLRDKYIFKKNNVSRDVYSVLLILSVILFYIISSYFIGFMFTCGMILIFLTIPLIRRNRLIILILITILSIVIYIIFAKILMVSLPIGLLFT